MAAIDAINKRHGKGKLYFAAEDLSKSWQPKHEIRSPRYLSTWAELPEARII
jgi:DNA polymerase V